MGVIYRQGNVIGNSRSSSVSAANGLWNLYELENRRRNNIWPEQIVRSSLVLLADAAIIESYPGSGSVWSDISENAYSASLIGSPTYSAIDGGYFVFNGTDQSAVSASQNIATNNFSFDLWAKPTATITVNAQATSGTTGTAGQRYVLGPAQSGSNGGAGLSLGTNGVSVYEHGSGYHSPPLSHAVAISSTLFSHIVIVYTNKQPSLYINGVFIKNGLTSLKTNVFYNKVDFIGGTYGAFAGQVSNVKIYSKSLTPTEVTQNFNALRSRYGI